MSAPGAQPQVQQALDYQGTVNAASRLGFDYDDVPLLTADEELRTMSKKRTAGEEVESARKRTTARAAAPSARGALSVATSARKTVNERVAAMAEATLPSVTTTDSLQSMLKVLRDRDEHIKVRLAALARFRRRASASSPSSRAAATTSPPCERSRRSRCRVRQRALGMLAREKDGFAQKKLIEGLEIPAKALVPPEKALQLLGYDVHADAYRLARKIVSKPAERAGEARGAAPARRRLRARPVFEKILRDKNESPDHPAHLGLGAPGDRAGRLQKHARAIVLDSSESDDLQAACLTAIAQFGDGPQSPATTS